MVGIGLDRPPQRAAFLEQGRVAHGRQHSAAVRDAARRLPEGRPPVPHAAGHAAVGAQRREALEPAQPLAPRVQRRGALRVAHAGRAVDHERRQHLHPGEPQDAVVDGVEEHVQVAVGPARRVRRRPGPPVVNASIARRPLSAPFA